MQELLSEAKQKLTIKLKIMTKYGDDLCVILDKSQVNKTQEELNKYKRFHKLIHRTIEEVIDRFDYLHYKLFLW